MKILHILPALYTGGGEKICIDLCNEMASYPEHEVTLCSLEPLSERQQIMYSKIGKDVKFMTLNKQGKSLKICWDIYTMIKEINPDIVHTHLRALHFAAPGIILSGKPNVHTIPTVANKESSKIFRHLYKILYKYFNFTPISMGEEVRMSVQELYGQEFDEDIEIGTTKIAPTAEYDAVKAEVDAVRKDENTKIFVSVGRLYPVKNQKLLIEAFKAYLQEDENAHLFVLGSKLINPEYASECETLSNGVENIHLVGEKSNVSDYLLQADALCFSSQYEGLPMTIVEAKSIGLPTIATPVGGIPDLIVDGVNGYLSKDMSVEAFKTLFGKIADGANFDTEAIEQEFHDKYSIKQCAKKYLASYEQKVTHAGSQK